MLWKQESFVAFNCVRWQIAIQELWLELIFFQGETGQGWGGVGGGANDGDMCRTVLFLLPNIIEYVFIFIPPSPGPLPTKFGGWGWQVKQETEYISETELTADAMKQDPNTQKVKKEH